MNQEELDALIKAQLQGNIDEDLDLQLQEATDNITSKQEEQEEKTTQKEKDEEILLNTHVDKQHKVIFQLDEVAKDSEMRANEVFGELISIQDSNLTIEEGLKNIYQYIQIQKAIFEKLVSKFPDIKIFTNALEETKQTLKLTQTLQEKSKDCDQHVNDAINTMQFQDIHQQKINRVIHVIQSLAQYMNSLFESQEQKGGRAQPARHIVGDGLEDTISQDEIEKLIDSLGKK